MLIRLSNAKLQKTDNTTKEKGQKNVLNVYFETFSTYLDTICNLNVTSRKVIYVVKDLIT